MSEVSHSPIPWGEAEDVWRLAARASGKVNNLSEGGCFKTGKIAILRTNNQ